MKKLTILICVLAMLLALAGLASASKPEEGTFSITGDTTFYEYETLSSGRTKFHLAAAGGVTGYFSGTFTFEEWGIVDLDPETGEGSGRGTNHGLMTITTDDGETVVRFGGRAHFQNVWGNFTVVRGTGVYEDLHGQGEYFGDAGFVFTVEFTGRFHTHP